MVLVHTFVAPKMWQPHLASVSEKEEDRALREAIIREKLAASMKKMTRQKPHPPKTSNAPHSIPVKISGVDVDLAPLLKPQIPLSLLKICAHCISDMKKDHLRMFGRRIVIFPNGTSVTLTGASSERDVSNAETYLRQALAVLRERWTVERAQILANAGPKIPKKRTIDGTDAMLLLITVLRFRSAKSNDVFNVLPLQGKMSLVLTPSLPSDVRAKIAAAIHTRMFSAREADASGDAKAGGIVIFPGYTRVCLIPGRSHGEVLRDADENYLFEQEIRYPEPLTAEENAYCDPMIRWMASGARPR